MIHNISRFIAALALLATAQGAWADTETVSYIDADGNTQTATATVLSGGGDTTIGGGWYVVTEAAVTYSDRITVSSGGDVHLILADDASVTINSSYGAAIYFEGSGNLTIYGQDKGNGILIANAGPGGDGISLGGDLTINGGCVTARKGGDDCDGICASYGSTITLNPTRHANSICSDGYRGTSFTLKVADGKTLYDHTTPYSGTLNSDQIAAIAGKILRPDSSTDWTDNGDGTYTIESAAGWGVFCDLIDGGESFSGKTVTLGADITVSRMAGSDSKPFCGTFDGDGHTLTLDYGTAESPIDAQFVAPFVTTTWNTTPTFRNLTIGGTIYATHTQATDHDHVGGLIGHLFGTVTIEHCTSLVEIHAKGGAGGFVGLCEHSVSFNDCHSAAVVSSADGSNSGFVAWSRDSKWNINFTGCLFDGKLLQQNGNGGSNGGFIGWKGDAKTVNITNCLCAPAPLADGETMATDGSATFSREHSDHAATIKNSYYTAAFEISQGKALHTVTAGTDVTIEAIALTGTATQYTVSGITAYSGGGLQRGQTLYYGIDDQLSLTLSNSATGAPQGYQYAYTASAGTLSGTTLTMPDEDVTISVALAPIDWATVNQGSPKDPYMIYNKDQLLLLAHRVNGTNGETAVNNGYYGKFFKLGADITFEHAAVEGDDYAENYEAIGGYIGGTYSNFKGNFDGDGHTVSGIRIRKTGSGVANSYQGLFGHIDGSADIHDVHLTDARITGYENVGGIVGLNYGTVSGCSVTDSYITATGNWHYGTICGWNDGTLTNNYYHGCTVNGTAVTSGVGCQEADITANNGALPAYAITFGDGVSTTALASAPENGFVYNGVSYYREGLALPLACTEGYSATYYVGSTALDGTTYTVNATDCDVTINATLRSDGLQHEVSYMTADGTARTAKAIALDGTETSLAAGWYFVGKDISYDATLTLTGDVNLILVDGKTMNVGTSGNRISGNGIKRDGDADLTIYGQTAQTGTLSVYVSGGYWNAIGPRNLTINGGNVIASAEGKGANGIKANGGGDITINRGNVNATATGSGAWGIASQGNVEINGGTVNASGDVGIQSGNNLAINGGNITASSIAATIDGSVAINGGNVTASRISTLSGTITLGWTRPADRITASSISTDGGTVAVADGQALTDGSGHIYTGTLTASELSGFAAETTLQPCLALADAADNAAAIDDHAGQPLAVALSGRTLYKDGSWNTLCLPFAVDLTASGPLSGDNVQAMTLNTTTSSFADGTLTLNFTAAETIPAGTPFIIKWDESGTNITNPVFEGVTIDAEKRNATVAGVLTFTGTYAPVSIGSEGDKTKLYLGAANKLYYPNAAMTIGCQRAYFQLLGDLTAGEPTSPQSSHVRAFNLNFGDDETTGIISVHDSGFMVNGSAAWYTLDGRRLDGQPTAKGLYIHGGKKVAIK